MTELAALMGKAFVARRDVKAVQQRSGIYTPERTPFTMNDLRDHIAGKRSLGHYLVTPEGNTRVVAFDIDLMKSDGTVGDDGLVRNPLVEMEGYDPFNARAVWRTDHPASSALTIHLQRVAVGLAIRLHKGFGYHTAITFSGNKGLHVYGLPFEEISATTSRGISEAVMRSFDWEPHRGENFWRSTPYPAVEIETFPKQSKLDNVDSLGNLMRLPMGTNLKSGQRSFFIQVGSPISVLRELDPVEALTTAKPWQDLSA